MPLIKVSWGRRVTHTHPKIETPCGSCPIQGNWQTWESIWWLVLGQSGAVWKHNMGSPPAGTDFGVRCSVDQAADKVLEFPPRQEGRICVVEINSFKNHFLNHFLFHTILCSLFLLGAALFIFTSDSEKLNLDLFSVCSCAGCANDVRPDGDEEGCCGQRHAALPPSVLGV